MIVHAFVVYCLALNPTMCQEQEIIPDTYERVTSVQQCMRGYATFAVGGGFTDLNGAAWIVKGVRCKTEGSLPTTSIQAYLHALVPE